MVSQTRECTKTVSTVEGVRAIGKVFSCREGYWSEMYGKCVSRAKCVLDAKRGVVLEPARMCVGKADWLHDSPLNYLSLGLEAKQV